MSLKTPLTLKALARPDLIFGMHLYASFINLGVLVFMGIFTNFLWGALIWVGGQVLIYRFTKDDPYFLEVFLVRLLVLKKTAHLNRDTKGNRYAV